MPPRTFGDRKAAALMNIMCEMIDLYKNMPTGNNIFLADNYNNMSKLFEKAKKVHGASDIADISRAMGSHY